MKMPPKQRVTEQQKTMPVGTAVNLRKDDGTIIQTRTRNTPWQLSHGMWVVSVDGIAGGYDLERITPV